MERSPHIAVHVDLSRICRNAEQITRETGVAVIAMVKADAYGLGAKHVVRALADVVDQFCFFGLHEAMDANLKATGKTAISQGYPPPQTSYQEYLEHRFQPAVWTIEQAKQLKRARPILAVDTGMQRFACPAENVAAVLEAGDCNEAFTHATTLDAVRKLKQIISTAGAGRITRIHAAGSSLLHEPEARLDAVRPGLALYRGAMRVSCRLVDARDSCGPVGYTGFAAARHGVILAGYYNGLRIGLCRVNGVPRRIMEVGMQSAYVELGAGDSIGDEVVLLGDGLSETVVAQAWNCSPHEAIVRLSGMGIRQYDALS